MSLETPKLTEVEREALRGFAQCLGRTMTDYQADVLKLKPSTLGALRLQNLIRWDALREHWQLTDLGRAALEEEGSS